MAQQRRLGFDDPDSLTRDAGLSVVRASSDSVEPFDVSMFAGFTSMRALTYTASMRMIVSLLRDHEYDDFECIFGHSGILRPDISDVLAFQGVVEADLIKPSWPSRRRTSGGRRCSTWLPVKRPASSS